MTHVKTIPMAPEAPRRVIERKKKIVRTTMGKITVTYMAFPADEMPLIKVQIYSRNKASPIYLDT